MDELLALLDEEQPEESVDDDAASSSARRNQRPTQRLHVEKREGPSPTLQVALTVDDRIGIRMLNRKMSGLDLLNLITDYPYHSPAQLSAYSLASLNKVLADPAAVLDAATVCGIAELVTVGLVFSNSGTRLASSGNAYCALTIGNLTTGPAISVLLFGSSYSKHCRSCSTGKVVALVNPRLIPPKTGGNDGTAVTFSVNDEQQLIVVADARDYGCCKATTRAKNEHGQWVSNGKPCKNFIDKRISEYCQIHRNQERAQAALARGGTTSSMQQLRLQANAFPTAQGNKLRTLVGNQNMMMIPTSKNPSVGLMTHAPMNIVNENLAGNSLLNPRGQASNSNHRGLLSNITLQRPTKKQMSNTLLNPQASHKQIRNQAANSLLCSNNLRHTLVTATTNPYAQRSNTTTLVGPSTTKASATPSHKVPPKTTSRLVTGDILQNKPKRRADGQKRHAVNTDTTGYNGSVLVPIQSKIFAQQKPTGFFPQTGTKAMVKHEKSAADVLAQQQFVAAQLRERKAAAEDALRTTNAQGGATAKKRRRDETSSTSSLRDSLFGSLEDIDRDEVMSAKSRFAHEADAEEYARSRRVVNELEQEESKKEFKAAKKAASQETGSKSIEKEWHCLTCKKTFPQKPVSCIRLNHRLKVDRKIRAVKSIAEKRLELTEKKAEDGGLILGSGLEWSRWNRFS
jgi:minichromosome maintenance protein 10